MSRLRPAVAAAVVVVTLAGCGAATAGLARSGSISGSRPKASPTTRPAGSSPPTTSTTGSSTTTAPPRSTSRSYGTVNRHNATAVAEAMLKATFTYNTSTDKTPQAGVVRSAIWYTPTARAKLLAAAPQGSPGAQWITWTEHHATTTVALALAPDAGAPPDTATAAYRQFAVTVTPHGQAGWTGTPDTYACFVTLTRTSPSSPWQVASLETTQ